MKHEIKAKAKSSHHLRRTSKSGKGSCSTRSSVKEERRIVEVARLKISPVARSLNGRVRRTAIGGPLERLPRELVGVSPLRFTQNGSFHSHNTRKSLHLRGFSKVFSDGMFTQCFGPNSNLSFGLFLAVTVRSSDGPFD